MWSGVIYRYGVRNSDRERSTRRCPHVLRLAAARTCSRIGSGYLPSSTIRRWSTAHRTLDFVLLSGERPPTILRSLNIIVFLHNLENLLTTLNRTLCYIHTPVINFCVSYSRLQRTTCRTQPVGGLEISMKPPHSLMSLLGHGYVPSENSGGSMLLGY